MTNLHDSPAARRHACDMPQAPSSVSGTDRDEQNDSSLPLVVGLVVGLLVGGALVAGLLYRARPQRRQRRNHWYRGIRDLRDDIAEQVAQQLKQVKQVASAVASEIERG